ncbi:MAG: magnesium chelatase [Planctomycetota bacterium]|jgi:magnesium chelatase subunit I|nr:magnesium chelatase [Planctomycetota bacterium]
MTLPSTLGGLDRERFAHLGVRDEVRRNLMRKIAAGEELFPGIVGYEDTVVPQVVNALMARHDLILLGLRGQAKTRLSRMLVSLLDEWTPMVAGSQLREHPLAPVTEAIKRQVEQQGDATPLQWLHRDQRYGEKLATPDVTVADLIGDVDPLKAAHRKLDLSDEEVIHFGIVPRSNRGIFCVNEIPDLAPRIQVALLNLLEEQDIQIRGFPLRIPLDVVMVFTANPEDYTNRGSIITPLKDRIASQITTHYPRSLADSKLITMSEAWTERNTPKVQCPSFIDDIVEEIAFRGRESEFIDQKSGVSARLTIAARELLHSQVEVRALRHPKDPVAPRIIDLQRIAPGITGKVELVYEGEQEGAARVAHHLLGESCQTVFDRLFPMAIEGDDPSPADDTYKPILDWFARGATLDITDANAFTDYAATLDAVPGLGAIVSASLGELNPAERACAMELVIEGLHQHNLLSKQDLDTGASYGDMLRSMMGSL